MLSKLFQPITIRSMTLPNRIVMTAMHLNYTPNGFVSDQLINFYRARARGEAGLVIVGGAEINDEACGIDMFLSIKDDRFIPGLKKLTDAIHEEGGKIAVQLYMAGAYSFASMKGLPLFAPSEFTALFTRQKTTPMTLDDIHRVQGDFVACTRRAREAGFDAVEVLASAGYLICQFLSPKTNKRDDEYGGVLENRMRFGREVVEQVREAAGADLPVIVRVAGNDFVPESHTNKEARAFALVCQEAGADVLNVTGGWHESRVPQITMDLPRAGYAYLARGIKEQVDIPVVACNRINDPQVAEELLEEGTADLVGVARGLIADPEFPRKAREGRFDEIRRCVACNQRCFDRVFQLQPVGCMVNPVAGNEGSARVEPAAAAKRILVAGAGPAGCEFACTAAARGHTVVLCERDDHIGGQVEWSAISSGKPEYPNMFRYYRAQLADAGVELRLQTEVTPALVNQENPGLVVIATGAAPFSPPIDAENLPNVVQAWDVLRHDAKTGSNVVVVGGGSVGLETAIYLAAKGTISQEQVYFLTLHKAEDPEILWDLMTKGTKNVTVLEMAGRVGQDLGLSTRWVVMKDLTARGVQIITKATMKDIRPGEVAYTDGDGREQVIPADTVVLAMGARPENSLVEQLKPTGVPLEVIGDAAKVGRIGDAVEQGFRLACEV